MLRRSRSVVRLLLPGVLLASSGLVAAPPASAAETPVAVRILLVGDSVTQGSAGDFTWRYRLWQHFRAAGVAVDFVGPRADLYDNVLLQFGNTDYADPDPDFDRDHAGRWGMALDVQDVPIGTLVADYDPDVVVEMLGVNDLTFGGQTPGVVAERVRTFVGDARAADPTVDLVLSEATQTWREGVIDFNSRVAALASELGTEASPVTFADADTGFDQYADTWDTAHPNARGEVKIAAAMADALHALGVGPAASRPLPVVPVGPRAAPVLRADPGDRRVALAWTGPPGATHEYVWIRDVTRGAPWHRLPFAVTGLTWTGTLPTNGHRYDVKLQPLKGDEVAAPDIRSNVVSVVPQPAPPPRVARVELTSRTHALAVRWPAARRATSYRLTWWPTGNTAAVRRRTVSATAATLPSLLAGRTYAVTVRARNGGGRGPVSPTATARALGPRPDAPSGFTLSRARGHRIHVAWRAGKDATRYQVEVRRWTSRAWTSAGWTGRRTLTTAPQLSGRRYAVRVRSWHQYVAGGHTRTRSIRVG